MDTRQSVAEERILTREGHFYKVSNKTNNSKDEIECDRNSDTRSRNSDWEFQPVHFTHTVLDGDDTILNNARRIVEVISANN